MVVGGAAAGKTTMISRLQGVNRRHLVNHRNISTDGVDMGDFLVGNVKFICWDFGGQVLSLHSSKGNIFKILNYQLLGHV
jgi:GTPase SAR1 family protein